MKQYTNESQTAKLIELGFEKPKYECLDTTRQGVEKWNNIQRNYYIGELIEMLPEKVTDKHEHDAILQMTCFNGEWRVKYAGAYDLGLMIAHELIDALYYMVVQLKEEGVI